MSGNYFVLLLMIICTDHTETDIMKINERCDFINGYFKFIYQFKSRKISKHLAFGFIYGTKITVRSVNSSDQQNFNTRRKQIHRKPQFEHLLPTWRYSGFNFETFNIKHVNIASRKMKQGHAGITLIAQ